MKNTLIVGITLIAVALGVLCAVEARKATKGKAEIAALQTQVQQLSRELIDVQSVNSLLEQQRQETLAQASQLAAKVQTQPPLPASTAGLGAADANAGSNGQKSASEKNPFGQFLAKMMDDPDTKKMIRDQQRLMLDQLYGPLAKQMGLQPEEAEQFKNLLADNMLKGAEKATSLFGDGGTNRAELVAKLAEDQKNFDEQVRSFLGETRYAQYKDYQETVGERTQLNQFRQTATGANALSDQQTDQLLAFMKEEKQAMASAGGFSQPQDAASMQAMLSGEGLDKMMQSQEAIGQRVYERARSVLSDSQLAAFGRFQTNQLQMMRMGMSMARKFMGAEKPAAAPLNP